MESAKKIISRREFEWLSQFNHHTPEEVEKMKMFLDEREKKGSLKSLKNQNWNLSMGMSLARLTFGNYF